MSNKPVESFGISRFISEETIGGIILIGSTIIALFWANSAFYDLYHYVWEEIKVGYVWGETEMVASIHHWINDGLMALFFFTVGLEIKREVMGGELSSIKQASLPIAAAVGGMIFPALIYVIIEIQNPEYMSGWGIPMATDIAFALGLLAMLGKRVPISLKIFLTALAIADDLGAVLVIAFFYTDSISVIDLMYGGGFIVILIIANILGVRRTIFYGLVGFLGVWTAFIFSGVHATIAGVLIALTIPARTKISERAYANRLTTLTKRFKEAESSDDALLTEEQVHVLSEVEVLNQKAHTPLQRLEHAMHPVTTYFILPLFALANAGVHITGSVMDLLVHPISIGIGTGLVLGKFLGITLLSKLMVRFKLATLPEGVTWKHIYGVAFLAGIGFTMSMFISELAFIEDEYKQIAKVGIMVASLISAAIGLTMLATTPARKETVDA
jgi:NhaA family Na+:H+ antiporter